ncbi:SIS domain-containing protein [Austwickia chelonae]|nr:SIS domain-containing protein [Austwickia chelonae]
MPMIDEAALDDARRVAELDSRDTLRALATAGAQVREAMTLAVEAGVDRLAGQGRPRSVLVASLGGSAVVGDILDLLAEPGSPVPVTIRRNVPLPGWVGPLDLVVAVSLSGRAPGPLAVAAEAARRGAALVTVGAAESPLAAVCAQARGVHIDSGRGRISSRTALWSMVTPVLMAADRLGIVEVSDALLQQVADRLDECAETCRPSSEAFVNPAKVLALQLAETVPVVLGEGDLGGVAAHRAASMLARTARLPATHGALPDAASQVVATFDGPFTAGGGDGVAFPRERDIFADPFLDGPAQPQLGLLLLRDEPESIDTPEVAARAALVDGVVATAEDAGVRVLTVSPEPGPALARLAGLMATTDFTSTYLAIGLGIDPAISRHIAELRDHTRR